MSDLVASLINSSFKLSISMEIDKSSQKAFAIRQCCGAVAACTNFVIARYPKTLTWRDHLVLQTVW